MLSIDEIQVATEMTLISLHGFPDQANVATRLFTMISESKIIVDMISQVPSQGTGTALSFTVTDEDFSKILQVVTKIRDQNPQLKLYVSCGNTKITLFSEKMPDTVGVAEKAFIALQKAGADVLMVTTSEKEISFLLPQADEQNAIQEFSKAFDI